MNMFKPCDIDIQSILLYNYKGESITLMQYFLTMNIQEDLFASVTTGNVLIRDPDNLMEVFPIIGEETLEVTYRTNEKFEWVTRKFYVSECSNKAEVANKTYAYTLSFTSEEFMINKTTLVTRSFNNLTPSSVAEIVLTNILKTSKAINVENSIGVYTYIAPSIRPFEVIRSMTNKAKSAEWVDGAAFMFFENKDGFNFVSLESLYNREAHQYEVGNQNAYATDESFNVVRAISRTGAPSILTSVSGGALGVKAKSLNLLTKQVTDVSYDYFDDAEYTKVNRVNGSTPTNRLTTSKYKYKSKEGVYKFMVGTANSGSDYKHVNLAKRYAQLSALSSGQKIHIEVAFNSDITVGDMIYLKILTSSISDSSAESQLEEKYSSGKYIITCLRHQFGTDKGFTYLELSRDSYSNNHEEDDETTYTGQS